MLTVWTSPTVSSTSTRITVHGDISSRATSLSVNLPHLVLIKASCWYKSVKKTTSNPCIVAIILIYSIFCDPLKNDTF